MWHPEFRIYGTYVNRMKHQGKWIRKENIREEHTPYKSGETITTNSSMALGSVGTVLENHLLRSPYKTIFNDSNQDILIRWSDASFTSCPRIRKELSCYCTLASYPRYAYSLLSWKQSVRIIKTEHSNGMLQFQSEFSQIDTYKLNKNMVLIHMYVQMQVISGLVRFQPYAQANWTSKAVYWTKLNQ